MCLSIVISKINDSDLKKIGGTYMMETQDTFPATAWKGPATLPPPQQPVIAAAPEAHNAKASDSGYIY
jgi:hypothetical protein